MRATVTSMLLALAACGGGPELDRVAGTLEAAELGPFLQKLARHCEALDAEDAAALAAEFARLDSYSSQSTRRAVRRSGRLVSAVEINVTRLESGRFEISLRTTPETADTIRGVLK